jgi:hypothetical protein
MNKALHAKRPAEIVTASHPEAEPEPPLRRSGTLVRLWRQRQNTLKRFFVQTLLFLVALLIFAFLFNLILKREPQPAPDGATLIQPGGVHQNAGLVQRNAGYRISAAAEIPPRIPSAIERYTI